MSRRGSKQSTQLPNGFGDRLYRWLHGQSGLAGFAQRALALGSGAVYIDGDNKGIVNTGFMLTVNGVRGAGRRIGRRELANQISRYLASIAAEADTVSLITGRHNLAAVHVPLYARRVGDDARAAPFNLDFLLGEHKSNAIILADGGQGKSISLYNLMRLLAGHLQERRGWTRWRNIERALGIGDYARLPIPVYCPLALYAEALREPGGAQLSLAAFLDKQVQAHAARLPDGFVSTLIARDAPLVLLLDGLDEVLDNAQRADVAARSRQITLGKSRVRAIVTSRAQAYGRAEDLGDAFAPFTLEPFRADQRNALIDKHYRAAYPTEASGRAAQLRTEIDALEKTARDAGAPAGGAPPLIDSPLMTELAILVRDTSRGPLPRRRVGFLNAAIKSMLSSDYALDKSAGALVAGFPSGWPRQRDLLSQVAASMMRDGPQSELTQPALTHMLKHAGATQGEIAGVLARAAVRGGLLRRPRHAVRFRFAHALLQAALAARRFAQLDPGAAAFVVTDQGRLASPIWREIARLIAGYLSESAQSDVDTVDADSLADDAKLCEYLDNLGVAADDADLGAAERVAALEIAVACAREYLGNACDPLKQKLVAAIEKVYAAPELMSSAPARTRVDLGNALGAWGDPRREVMTVDGMRFCHVPKGAFWMGSDEYEDEGPAGWVDIPYDFWMGEHPVSNAQFAEFMADGGYGDGRWWSVARAAGVWRGGVVLDEVEKIVFAKLSQAQKTQLELAASERRWSDHRRLLTEARALAYEREERREPADLSGYVSNTTYALFSERLIHLPNHPVVGIGWYDALAFCEWLAERLKTVLPPGHRVTLPSEAEYEKTARGGKVLPGVAVVDARFARPGREVAHEANSMPQRRFSQGDVFEHNKANTAEGAINVTSPLGAYGVNAYGCSDLDGNVRAWTRSLYGDFNYSTGYAALEFRYPYDVTDETRERLSAPKTVTRVVRGGAFVNIQDGARCAYRGRNRPDLRNLSIGFRVCVSPISR